ncbi:unannotated protein [freshwater metagenome]|uniref:Unannotated protein n=1 Tax=freshwater metagenome TaxID=449393 RepID=A0A6J6WUB0_9ZZZZ|nr:hypothetical protein [Actinomycetota bacterium]MSV64414.1 hypothetical protein [Actinomycetota bacterium]MSW26292.1 hypothetical protein [Actinomycetota bacterium]MSW34609.1 hypothetical protein [Actinomycetota bacterium]MSX31635.1 hypothetical protein [Actinomycetota bacterium]
MDIVAIRSQWVSILDRLERKDHIAWLAFFDARLVSIDRNTLSLDYSDSQKFATSHQFTASRQKHTALLEEAIFEVLGTKLTIAQDS